MNSRERINLALNHQEPDRVPLDLGGGPQTGMHVSSVYKLRQVLELPEEAIKVIEPYQMLGEIKPDMIDVLGIDVVPLYGLTTMFGYKNENWKPWTFFDGTPLLVPEKFNTEPDNNGNIYAYPQGDKSVPPSAVMPKNGFFFDAIPRQQSIDENNLNIEDNLEEFGPIPNEELGYLETESRRLFEETDKAIYLWLGVGSFGDIALVTAVQLKNPKGIRGIEEWYTSLAVRSEFIIEIFKRQFEIAFDNLKKVYSAVGNRVDVAFISGTDFGGQSGPLFDPRSYVRMQKPFHEKINDWIHQNTKWKTFKHSCGSVYDFYNDFIDAGFDILNPVQCSAANMEPETLKREFGNRAVFWGGGIDTQKTLPFGSVGDVRKEVKERIKIFAPGGGFVFNPIHNIQAKVPPENLLMLYKTVREYGKYPITI